MGLTLDTGALIALERDERRAWRVVAAHQRRDAPITVPTPVLAQFWRKRWIAPRFRKLMGEVSFDSTTTELARGAGELLGRTATSDAVDAIVACGAAARGDVILTSDPEDLQRLTAGLGTVRVLAV